MELLHELHSADGRPCTVRSRMHDVAYSVRSTSHGTATPWLMSPLCEQTVSVLKFGPHFATAGVILAVHGRLAGRMYST